MGSLNIRVGQTLQSFTSIVSVSFLPNHLKLCAYIPISSLNTFEEFLFLLAEHVTRLNVVAKNHSFLAFLSATKSRFFVRTTT